MRRRLAGAAAAAIAALAPAAPLRAECKLAVMLSLPITMQGLRPTTIAQINGTDAPFLVDSGAFFSVITPGSAKQFALRLSSAPPGFFLGGIGGSTAPSVTSVRRFGVAGQTLDNVPFLVGGSEIGQDSTGVIGYNVLGIGDAEYDLAHGTVRLIKPSGCARADFPFWHSDRGASEIAIEPGPNGRATRIAATASVNGTSIRVVFDTGAAGSALGRAAAKRAGIDVDGPDARPSGVSGGFGKRLVREWTVPVTVFKIGDEEIHNTRLRVIDALSDGPDAPDMLLGADFFLSHHIYVARDLHRVYFTYNGGNVFNLRPIRSDGATAAAGTGDVAAPGAAATPPGSAATQPGLATGTPQSAAGPPGSAAVSPGVAAPAAPGEPTSAEGFAARGSASAARRDYAAAIADLTRAVALAPTEPRYLSERATAYAGNRQPYLAMADLDAALRLRPGDVPTLMRRAAARLAGHDRAGAAADIAAADAAAPKEADVRFAIGAMYERLDNLPAAIAQLDLWLAVHRDDNKAPAAFAARCRARAMLGTDLDQAAKDCATARRGEPGNVAVLDSMALVDLRRGDYARAVADYDAVLAKAPQRAWALYGRGVARLASGATTEGNADIATARAIAPDLPAFARAHGIAPRDGGSTSTP